ncbi:MAG TPA: aminoglycoside phosphotransferase family protein [Candidatus Saccharimonadales bacterium]|nr:aminoglycoside phosphotransferase family protein [Candidatus Saccharimonadales bacterium]
MKPQDYQAKLKSYIQTLDPKIFGLSSTDNISLKRLSVGLHNVNFLISFKDRKFVLRFHPGNKLGQDKTADEASGMKLLKDLPVPDVLSVSKPDFLDSSVMIIEFVEGSHQDFNDLSTDKVRALARVVAKIHKIKRNVFSKALGAPPITEGNYENYVKAIFDSSVVHPLSLIDPKLYDDSSEIIAKAGKLLDSALADLAESFVGREFSLMHTDIGRDNVLWVGNDPKIIDWEEITFGDPADEVSYIFAINNLNEKHQNIFLDEYLSERTDASLKTRLPIYTLKNRLFDLVWSLSKLQQQKSGQEPQLMQKSSELYQQFYDVRREALANLVDES